MNNKVKVFVFVDALGWKQVERYDFLRDLLPNRRKIEMQFGYSCTAIPTILTGERGFSRRRSAMVVLCGVTMSVAMVLQVVWPLTPFTSLGCLIVNCFFQVFVIQDEQSAKHAAELEDALERAHAAEKARNMFFSIVSHDIRTPLNAILGYSELLEFGISDKAEREGALKAIRSSGTTLLQLVNDVLDISKIDSGELVLRPRPMRLSGLVDEAIVCIP